MFKKAPKIQVISTLVIFLWIFIVNIAAVILVKVPTWPMFFVTIFFFLLQGDKKKIPTIFLSGIVGIGFAFLLYKGIVVFSPAMGTLGAVAVLLFVILGLIIVGGNYFPVIFSNITFAYLTIASIDLTVVEQNFLPWILMLIIGGAIILLGSLGSLWLLGKIFAPKDGQPAIADSENGD